MVAGDWLCVEALRNNIRADMFGRQPRQRQAVLDALPDVAGGNIDRRVFDPVDAPAEIRQFSIERGPIGLASGPPQHGQAGELNNAIWITPTEQIAKRVFTQDEPQCCFRILPLNDREEINCVVRAGAIEIGT